MGCDGEDICILVMYFTTNLLNWITLIKSSLIFRIEIFLSPQWAELSQGVSALPQDDKVLKALNMNAAGSYLELSDWKEREGFTETEMWQINFYPHYQAI